jgi:glucuronokinase
MVRRPARGRAYARVALAGNPSDGYGGAVLALTLSDFAAEVTVAPAAFTERPGPWELIEAATRRFSRYLEEVGEEPFDEHLLVRCSTTIPRQVGLGGSSAIVIATLRALCRHRGIELAPDELASMALAAETRELRIPAGPQDRYAQAHEGLVLMDFAGKARVERLDAGSLPPLFVAYRTDAAEASGVTHSALRERSGTNGLDDAMAELGELARSAAERLRRGEGERIGELMDRSFDIRRSLLTLDPRHEQMIETARAHGACANYTGSGGAIVGVRPDGDAWPALSAALEDDGCVVIKPSDLGQA